MTRKQTHVSFTPELLAKIDAEAKAKGLNRSDWLDYALNLLLSPPHAGVSSGQRGATSMAAIIREVVVSPELAAELRKSLNPGLHSGGPIAAKPGSVVGEKASTFANKPNFRPAPPIETEEEARWVVESQSRFGRLFPRKEGEQYWTWSDRLQGLIELSKTHLWEPHESQEQYTARLSRALEEQRANKMPGQAGRAMREHLGANRATARCSITKPRWRRVLDFLTGAR